MQQGDFTECARFYEARPGYGTLMLQALARYTNIQNAADGAIADIGAGTGKWTQQLAALNQGSIEQDRTEQNRTEQAMRIYAIEPNDAMRAYGIANTKGDPNVFWQSGNAHAIPLPDASVQWVTMASAFHWTDPKQSLPEFARILKPNGYLTVLWNPRAIDTSPLQQAIEAEIKRIVPELHRVSSGLQQTQDWSRILTSTGHFKDPLFMECEHIEQFTQERYLNAWRSVNDIQAQAGPERWVLIIQMIQQKIQSLQVIPMHYKIRAWTVQKTG